MRTKHEWEKGGDLLKSREFPGLETDFLSIISDLQNKKSENSMTVLENLMTNE